jgi:two-component system cell cycle sensor histidine kinase/response regulator CckA
MQAIGQLAGGVAHDFNNLLTVISGYCEMLLMDHNDLDDPTRAGLEAIRDAGERASLLTRQLLLFSRKAVSTPRVLDPNAVVKKALEMIGRRIGEHVTVTTALAPSVYRIRADGRQIEQVIMNLALNARDAMSRGGGRLTIETRNAAFDAAHCQAHPECKVGHFVQLVVSDTGCGIPTDCRVVFMSGYNEDAVVHHGLDHVTHAFLQKPFTPLVLARKLREVLDRNA